MAKVDQLASSSNATIDRLILESDGQIDQVIDEYDILLSDYVTSEDVNATDLDSRLQEILIASGFFTILMLIYLYVSLDYIE